MIPLNGFSIARTGGSAVALQYTYLPQRARLSPQTSPTKIPPPYPVFWYPLKDIRGQGPVHGTRECLPSTDRGRMYVKERETRALGGLSESR
jgi:hypothetical protein